ncbi:MAG: hypothetical protein CMN76_02005 [Spirochaetaceae bacterium]|nr:hypothetical protein [Spirochaetaceae bacterium]
MAPAMNPEDVARAAVRDEKSILEFTKSRMDSMDGKVCQRIPALQEELQNRFQLLRKANEHRKSNFETVVGEFSDERQLYFQLRQERDQQLQIAWEGFIHWQQSKCTNETSLFSDPIQRKREALDQSLNGLRNRTLALRLALFRFLSRLDLEQRKAILLP